MLTSKAYGLELEVALKENRHDLLETYIMQSAKWLAKLHSSTTVSVQNNFSVQSEEEKLRNWFQHLSYLYPDFSERMQKILHYIVLKERSVDRKYYVFIHGDFHPLNILLDGIDLTAEVVKALVGRADVYKARSYIQHLQFRYWTLKKKHDDLHVEYWVSKAEECTGRYA